MRKLTIIVGSFVSGLVVGACGSPDESLLTLPQADLVAQACVDCPGASRAAVLWFLELEDLFVQDVVLDLTQSGRETMRGPQVVTLAELRDFATEIGMQQGLMNEVLDCDDDRILLDQPRCEMRRGEVLLTLLAPRIRGSTATLQLQRWGPGPGGPWWMARYELTLERTGGDWKVAGHELTSQS